MTADHESRLLEELDIERSLNRLHELYRDLTIDDAELADRVRNEVLVNGLWPRERRDLLNLSLLAT